MEAVILVGLPGAGKSTFYHERFRDTHLRVNLDMLKTRHRERRFVELCADTGLRFVADNTNPTRAERALYIAAARAGRFRVVGYAFPAGVEECDRRNRQRPPARVVPRVGVLGCAARLERPSLGEGFDALFTVTVMTGGFRVEEWPDEV